LIGIRIKENDILARQSGDEFLVCLKNIRQIHDVSDTAKRIVKSSDPFFEISKLRINITFSIGISIYPDDGTSVEELLKNADQTMYLVKAKYGNGYKFFNKNHEIESHRI
jgi:diguanylate cyclase (GGDEF)-like protein